MTLKLNDFGFLQLDPIPTNESLQDFYESQYYHLIKSGGRASDLKKLMEKSSAENSEYEWLSKTLYLDCLDAILENSCGESPVLDVGCGTGGLVEFLLEAGIHVEGVEPSREAVEMCIKKGLSVSQGTLQNIQEHPDSKAKYRALILLNVLEHIPAPIELLASVKPLLDDNGLLILRVPNDFSEIQFAAEQIVSKKHWWVANPDHINYFNLKSINKIFAKLGFKIVDFYSDFPVEFFILFGMNYIDEPNFGSEMHKMRCNFELNIPKDLRRKIYRQLVEINVGRNLFIVARSL